MIPFFSFDYQYKGNPLDDGEPN
jgi:hypothetical protein